MSGTLRNATERLATARAVRDQVLAGRSPRERGDEKEAQALRWVYEWGWSAPSILDALASPKRRGLARRLVAKGLLRAEPTPGGRGVRGCPAEVVMLTPGGVAQVEALMPEPALLAYPEFADRLVRWAQLRHDALVQQWTVRRLLDGTLEGYVTPRQMAGRPTATGDKIPDAIWRWRGLGPVAVELELTAKSERELAQSALALLRLIRPATEKDASGSCRAAVILSHSEAILARWRRVLSPGAAVKKYIRDPSRHWTPDGTFQVPAWAGDRVIFEQVRL
jgi:hypothetical protein